MSEKKKTKFDKAGFRLLALRNKKKLKEYRMSFEPSYASKEEYEQEQKRQERNKRRQEASDIRRKEQSTPKQRLAEKKAKKKKGGRSGGAGIPNRLLKGGLNNFRNRIK